MCIKKDFFAVHIYLHNYICTYIHTYITTCILFLYLVLKTSFIQLSILIFGLSDLIPGYLVFSAFIMALKLESQLIHQPNFIQFSYIFLFLNSRSLYLIIQFFEFESSAHIIYMYIILWLQGEDELVQYRNSILTTLLEKFFPIASSNKNIQVWSWRYLMVML